MKRKAIMCASLAIASGCASSSSHGGFSNGDAALEDDGGVLADVSVFGDGPILQVGDGAIMTHDSSTSVTTIYANTDDSLYTMDPSTNVVTLVGKFSGVGGGTNDGNITDCAVNAAGEVYVNSESVVYKAKLPANSGGNVALTKVATIAGSSSTHFFALAFAPAGVIGTGEALIGGDGNGELWSIDPSTGASKDLGNFGKDTSKSGNVFALSGDLVFYRDASGKATGLATIRSCQPKSTTCTTTDDYLAGIDMGALTTAYSTGTPASSLNDGIYGGTTSGNGSGTGHGDLFGLGAWNGDVFAFSRHTGSTSAELLLIDTTTGKASVVSSAFTFTNGWSGAGVTTSVIVTVPNPPNTPR